MRLRSRLNDTSTLILPKYVFIDFALSTGALSYWNKFGYSGNTSKIKMDQKKNCNKNIKKQYKMKPLRAFLISPGALLAVK